MLAEYWPNTRCLIAIRANGIRSIAENITCAASMKLMAHRSEDMSMGQTALFCVVTICIDAGQNDSET